jgi:aminopeptidase N
VRAGHAGIGSFLDLVGALGRETEADVLAALRGPLASLDDRIARPAGPELRRRTWDFLVETFGEQLARLGWEAAPGEDHDTRLRRAQVIAILGLGAEWEPVVEAAQRRCQAYLDDRTRLDADLVDPVVAIAARHGDTALWQRMRSAMDGAATPQERRRFLLALAEFRGAREVERTLSLAATSAVKTQDLPMLLGRALANEHARERTWEVLRKRWSALEKRLPSLLITRVVEALPALGTQEHRREVVDFFRRHPLPQAKRTLLQALERFDLDASFRRRAIPELRAWAEERRSRRES